MTAPPPDEVDPETGTDLDPPAGEKIHASGRARAPIPWRKYAIVGVVGLVLVVLAFLLIVVFLPISWAGTVGRQAAGTVTGGVAWGIFYGFVFTFVPLLVLSLAFVRRWTTIRTRLVFVVLAVLVSVPNLITLGIAVGTGTSAHTAERTMDVTAPLFRQTTLIAAIVAALAAAAMWVLILLRRRTLRELTRLRAERGRA